MKSKILLGLLLLSSYCGFAQNENLTGKWSGIITIDVDQAIPRTIYFNLQIKQSGKAVWGIYTTGEDSTFISSTCCTGKLTSKLSSGKNSIIGFFQDGIVENKIPLDICSSLNYIQASYSGDGKDEFLKGKWYSIYNNKLAVDGAAGRFVLEKLSTETDINIDQYFPRLPELIKKFNIE